MSALLALGRDVRRTERAQEGEKTPEEAPERGCPTPSGRSWSAEHRPSAPWKQQVRAWNRYSMRRPLMAREITSCWICSVPSKMSKLCPSRSASGWRSLTWTFVRHRSPDPIEFAQY